MPELTTAWITLSATTRGMERDIRQAINRAERGARITPEVDTSALGREGERAGRTFAQRFDRASDNLGSGMSGRGKSAGSKLGSAFLGGFSAVLTSSALTSIAEAAIGSLQSILESGLDFSKTLNNFQGVTRATAAEMASMQQTARSLGSDTTLAGASATDAASAMTELAKAGFSVDQAMTAARGTLELATAGQIDAAKAAEIQSNAMNAFNLNATDAAHVADLFANAAVASSADIPDLGEALQQVGGIAQGFGENLDDTIAALGIFANAGIKGSDAGTLLKTTMQSITDHGNPAQGAIKDLGLELYKLNSQGQNQFVGFRELFRQLDEAKKRLNDPEIFQAETNILFGSDAMRSAMLGNAKDFDDMLTKLEHVGGAAELAGSQMQGLPGAVESFSNAMEGIKLGAFDAFGPGLATGLNDFVNYLSDHKGEVIDFFVNLGDAAITMGQVMIASFGEAAGIIRPFADLLGFDDTAKSLQFVFDASQQAFDGLETARTGMHQYADRAKEAAQFTDALGKSVTTLKTVGDDVTIDVKDNTPEVRTKLDTLGAHLEQMADDPTRLKVVSDTREAENKINAYRQQQVGIPVDVPFTVHYDAGKSFLPDWFKYIGGTAGPAPMTINPLMAPLGQTNVVVPPGPGGAPPVVPSSRPTLGGIPFPPRPPGGRAAGGAIFGAGTATSDSIPAMLSNGEHVWTADEVKKAGGQSAMYGMRAMVRRFAGGGGANTGGGLTPNAAQLQQLIMQAFPQVTNIGGWRPPDGYNEHSSGEALDVMIPDPTSPQGQALGNQINQWLLQNADALGIQYDLWQQQDWKPDGSVSTMENRGGATANHMDHVHVRVKPGEATGASLGSMYGQSGQNGSYEVDQQAVFDAESRSIKARNDLEVQRKQLAELEAKGTATESQLLAARNDVVEQERDVQSADAKLAEAKQGKFKKGSSSASGSSGGGGMDGQSLGEGIFSGILQGIGLDGSVFSNPFEWPNVKSGIALANWGGGMLKTAMGQGEDSGGGMNIGGLNMPGIGDFMKPIGPQALSPVDPMTTQHGAGFGAPPGPTFNVTANGMDPKAVVQTQQGAFNSAYRKSGLPAVKP